MPAVDGREGFRNGRKGVPSGDDERVSWWVWGVSTPLRRPGRWTPAEPIDQRPSVLNLSAWRHRPGPQSIQIVEILFQTIISFRDLLWGFVIKLFFTLTLIMSSTSLSLISADVVPVKCEWFTNNIDNPDSSVFSSPIALQVSAANSAGTKGRLSAREMTLQQKAIVVGRRGEANGRLGEYKP